MRQRNYEQHFAYTEINSRVSPTAVTNCGYSKIIGEELHGSGTKINVRVAKTV